MADNIKTLIKKIDELCIPIFNLGGERGVKPKDLDKNFNKQPLADLAFNLFSCLYESRRQLDEQNRQLAKATSALKEQKMKVQELDTSIEEMSTAAVERSTIAEVLAEVKKNGERIAEMENKWKETQAKMVHETEKVSSYAEILKKSTSEDKTEIKKLQPKALVNGVISEMKISNRKRNLVFYGVPGSVNRVGGNIDYTESIDEILLTLGFIDLKPTSTELLKPAVNSVPKKSCLDLFNEDSNYNIEEDIMPCTVRVQFPTEAIAYKVLKNASRLKATESYSDVYIAPDRTPEEQKARTKLVEQLKLKIKEQPAFKWAIRRGEIVNCGRWEGRTNIIRDDN